MKVICIDSANKPKNIFIDEWIQEGIVYTIVEVIKMGLQPGKLGVRLKEVNLTKKSFPYEYYDSNRFIPIEGLVAKEQKIEEKEFELDLI